MNSLRIITLTSLIAAVPSIAAAQGKAPHPAPPIVMGRSAPVRQDNRADKIADKAERAADRTADQTARNADKVADKSARKADRIADKSARKADKAADKSARKADKAADKSERSELRFAHDQKHLTKGIRMTRAEKSQIKAIEKKYDAQYRALRKEQKADPSNTAFQSQVTQLEIQERADIRAALTADQQSIFDRNVTRLSSHK